MIKVNDGFSLLPESYLFAEVGRRVADFRSEHPDKEIIRMDIGDVSLPMFPVVTEAMLGAVADLADSRTFRGYGPEQGWDFLREAIARHDYKGRGLDIDSDEIFVSDGAKSDLGNLYDIMAPDIRVAVPSPGYPVYADAGIMDGHYGTLSYLCCGASSGFRMPEPSRGFDVVYICSPCNPTGLAMTREELSAWVRAAADMNFMIIFDSAYEAYVRTPDAVRSIYEITGAEKVAVEVRSFSKTAGFTGVRCGYTVVPKALKGVYADGSEVSLNSLWRRRQSTKFNGASYISQRGAAALYTEQGQTCVREATDLYIENARMLRDALSGIGFSVFGGEDSPYVWAGAGNGESSWELFDRLLDRCMVTSTPGSGFGSDGEGYLRLTGFNTAELTREAARRIRTQF